MLHVYVCLILEDGGNTQVSLKEWDMATVISMKTNLLRILKKILCAYEGLFGHIQDLMLTLILGRLTGTFALSRAAKSQCNRAKQSKWLK